MSISTAVLVAQPTPRAARHPFTCAALTVFGAMGMLATTPLISQAQSPTPLASTALAPAPRQSAWQLRFTSGALVPTGNQRNVLKDAQMSGVQLSWLVLPSVAVTGQLGWARSRDLGASNRPKLDVFTSDMGFEARPGTWFLGQAVSLSPFAGIGAGMRSYNYRQLDVNATNNLAGYGAVGGELGVGRVGLRLEARDYASGFKPLVGAGKSETRNDVVITAALRIRWHRTAPQ